VSRIDDYVGRDEYPKAKDYDGNWGIFDEPFLQFTARELNKRKSPFFATIFTLSSHHPYTIPEEHKERFKEGPLPILKSVEYADFSLHRFFETVKTMPWFEETLFIITADHTSQNYLPAYNTKIGSYAIPILFYAPKYITPRLDTQVVQHNDIFPSIIDFLGIEDSLLAFGTSAFDSSTTSFSISYINGIYQLIDSNYCLQFDGEKTLGLFNWKKDQLLQNNLIESEKELRILLENKIKAIIQQYNNRLIENRLMVK
jgi:phosphoglycerol transferase MdoB-like AlkP superfamily enzyme